MKDIIEKACTVEAVDIDMGDVILGRVIVFPLDIDQALLVVVLGPQVHTVLTVNGNPTSFGNVADNCISRHRIATLGNPDQ